METPIKIYVGIVPSEVGQGEKYTTVSKDFPKASEYIRKDALIEWANKEIYNMRNSQDEFSQGEKISLAVLIDKINSL